MWAFVENWGPTWPMSRSTHSPFTVRGPTRANICRLRRPERRSPDWQVPSSLRHRPRKLTRRSSTARDSIGQNLKRIDPLSLPLTPGCGRPLIQTGRKDQKAFAELYKRTSSKLFGVCLRMLRDRSEADEVLQKPRPGRKAIRRDNRPNNGGCAVPRLLAGFLFMRANRRRRRPPHAPK
jgi:hypothetical protein